MYDEKLEELINIALADGEITEKEKQILFKKAEELGIDLDEFEMVLNARLAKAQKAQTGTKTQSASKSDKMGEVKKCPSCGAIIQSYMGECSECGYALENLQANSSSQRLAEKLEEIEKSRTVNKDDEDNDEEDERIANAKTEIIRSFPIPNTKADLLEFILSLKSKITSKFFPSDNDPCNDAYKAKCTECINKAKILFPNDPMLKEAIAQFDKDDEDRKKKKRKKIILIASIALVPIILIIILCISIDDGDSGDIVKEKKAKTEQVADSNNSNKLLNKMKNHAVNILSTSVQNDLDEFEKEYNKAVDEAMQEMDAEMDKALEEMDAEMDKALEEDYY